jgi:hypothetical protein
MRRVSGFVPFIACFLLSSGLLCSRSSAAQQGAAPPVPDIRTSQVRYFSVNGTVTDAVTHAQLDNVKLELHSVTGGVVGMAFTSGSGGFRLDNVGDGNYTLVVDRVGYQIASLQVEVRGAPVYGIQVELLRPPDAGTPVNKGPDTVSQRELSIPRKAHEDMEKGMALLYGKSDYQGSLKPLEKATQEYPDYYEAYTQLGIAYMKLADTGNSEKAFRKAMEVSQERYPGAHMGLAELFLSGRRFAEAEPLSRKAAEMDSNSWQANSQLARALLGLHRSSEAETSALAAVALKPDNADLYLILANVHIQLQNERALLDDLNHYLKLAPTGPFAEQARLTRDKVQQDLAASQRLPANSSTTQPQVPGGADQ